jgi:hypothetical protein
VDYIALDPQLTGCRAFINDVVVDGILSPIEQKFDIRRD